MNKPAKKMDFENMDQETNKKTKAEKEVLKFPDKKDKKKKLKMTQQELEMINGKTGLMNLLKKKKVNVDKVLTTLKYEQELELLQIELIKLQKDVIENGRRVAIIFEGQDAAGKGGSIRRFIEHLNPRHMRVVALSKPTEKEKGQWYFQRYVSQLPAPGEIVLFDRSWYNRAVVEPVMGFCSEDQYETFMQQCPEFEHMLHEDNMEVIKLWYSISKEEQKNRFDSRKTNRLKQWKLSPVDETAQEMFEKYTYYKEQMFAKTHASFNPWIVVVADDKKKARLEAIRYILTTLNYNEKGSDSDVRIAPDPEVIHRYNTDMK